MVRHLLEGKTLWYEREQEKRYIYIWPACSDERGVEAVLEYSFDKSAMTEKSFHLFLLLRLSESTDIVGLATVDLPIQVCG